MRIKTLLAGACASLLMLAGCTGGGPAAPKDEGQIDTSKLSGEITFQTWALKDSKFTPYFEKLVSDFEAEHPGTTVKWIDQPGDGYEDKVLQQANSSSLPDVVNLPNNFAKKLSASNKLVDLKSAAPESVDKYVDGGVEAYTVDNGLYGYPWYLGTDLLWFNSAQLAEAGVQPPTSQEEYFTAAETAAKNTGGQVKLFSGLPGVDDLAGQGVPIFTDGRFTFNTPDAARLLDRYAALNKAGAMPPEALNNDYAGNSNLFLAGKVGYTTSTASFVSKLDSDAPNLKNDVKAVQRYSTPPLFVQGLSVSQDSGNKGLAMAFAQYATNDENQLEFVKIARGFLPGTKAGNENTAALTEGITDPLLAESVKIAAAQMPEAKELKPTEYSDDMDKFVKQQFALAMQGRLSSQEALDKAVDYCNSNL